MNSGIYKILNKINGKFYIGSAVNIDKRWIFHRWALRNNSHTNSHLQKAWNKYWEQSFEFVLLEKCDKKDLVEREQYWLDTSDCCNPNVGYNILKIARSAIGAKRTLEAKAKMSAWQTGTTLSEEHINKIRVSKRNFSKWPHSAGSRCKCHECMYKKSEYSLAWKAKKLTLEQNYEI